MNDSPVTYQNLFALLASLGFQEQRSGDPTTRQHVFLHKQSDTILAFGRESKESVTSADMLSTEVHLHARGIADQPLESLLNTMPVN